MKQLVLSAWTWVVAHPAESLGALSTLLYLAINVINSRVPVEKREHNGWYKVLDALAIATQKGSESKASWPVVGRSIAKAVASAVIAERETQAPPPPPPPSNPGYAEQWALGAIALVAVVALALSGCRMPAPDGCTPGARRCHEDTPQVCSPGQRWTPADVTCSTVGASCVVRDGVPACLRGEQ
jgi:hypothetical protein